MKNETGEFELVLGNRQLLSGFAVVVILFGVFFAMGYIVGRSATPSAHVAASGDTAPSPMANAADSRPQAGLGVQTPSAAAQTTSAPAADASPAPTPAAETPQPTTQPAAEARSVPAAAPEPAPTPAPPAEADTPQIYLQVMAVRRPEAEVVVKSLKDKGFPAMLAASPKEGIFRVLVGPYKDAASLGKGKAELENAGFHPFVQK